MFKCLESNKNHKKYFNKDLIERYANTYKFCNGDINKFYLMLRILFNAEDFIHANIWTAGKDLMKHHHQIKKYFTEA